MKPFSADQDISTASTERIEHVSVPHEAHSVGRYDVPIDLDDPHRAALDDNPEHAERPSIKTLLAVMFLALSYVCPISCGFFLISSILVPVGIELGDVENISWIVSGWSVASSISFSLPENSVTSLVDVGQSCVARLSVSSDRGTGLGLTEFCITVPWCPAAVLIAVALNTKTGAGWRWGYYIGIIYGVISLVGTFITYFPPTRPQHDFEKSRWQEIKEIDYIGCFLYTGGLTIFLIGLSWAGTPSHPWDSASTIALIVVGFFLLVLCFGYDFMLAKQPLFPLELLRQFREFTVLLVVVFVAGMVFYSMSGLLPQGSLYMFTSSQYRIGVIAVPAGVSEMLLGAFATLCMGFIGHLKLQIIVGLTMQTIAIACLSAVIPFNESGWMAFQFFGMGAFQFVTCVAYVIAGLNVPLRYLGLASGLIGTFRSAGGSVGNTIFNTILKAVVSEQLPRRISAAAMSNGFDANNIAVLIVATSNNALGVPDAFDTVPGATPAVQAAAAIAFREAYAAGFRRVFWSSIPFGVVAIIAALLIKDPSLYLTNHTAIHMREKAEQTSSVSKPESKQLDKEGA